MGKTYDHILYGLAFTVNQKRINKMCKLGKVYDKILIVLPDPEAKNKTKKTPTYESAKMVFKQELGFKLN